MEYIKYLAIDSDSLQVSIDFLQFFTFNISACHVFRYSETAMTGTTPLTCVTGTAFCLRTCGSAFHTFSSVASCKNPRFARFTRSECCVTFTLHAGSSVSTKNYFSWTKHSEVSVHMRYPARSSLLLGVAWALAHVATRGFIIGISSHSKLPRVFFCTAKEVVI